MKSKKGLYLLLCAAVLYCLHSCKQDSGWPLKIESERLLDSIPSGSGIVLKNDTAYIIGDDATGLYQLNLGNYQQQKIPITGLDYSQYREPREVKHDFESAVLVFWNGHEYLLAFGSGSGDISRDSMLMVSTSDVTDSKIISLKDFYSRLQSLTLSGNKEWNIEGATVQKDQLILFNRANNMIIKFNFNDFISYLFDDNAQFPPIEYLKIKLPFIQNHEARLSGACTLEDTHLLFSASVEDTPDWTKDGPVLGSFIGLYSLPDSAVVASYLLQDDRGVPLKEKIESLDILGNASGKELVLIAIGDNDNGTSNIFRLRLQALGLKEPRIKGN